MKVAAVQMDIRILEKELNLRRILEELARARRAGAELIIFPECALTGYCFTSLDEARPMAETIPGPSTEKLAAAAQILECTVVVGLLESEGERIYNSAIVVGPGGLLGVHRKAHLPCLGVDWRTTPGDTPLQVFDTAHGKVGINICFDVSFPEAARVLKLRGAQLLAIPTNWPVGSDIWAHTPNVRATENHFHVVAANRVGEERGWRFAGHSKIVDFAGKVHAEAGEAEETILYAELDLPAADQNRVIRIPGIWEYDRMAIRRPELYGPITEPKRA
jgi:predicted amidohydrolase